MKEETLFDGVVDCYVRHKCKSDEIPQDEFHNIVEAFKLQLLKDAASQIEKDELEKGKARADEEVKAYKRKTFQALKRSLIVEAILVAFCVGIIVNQVTTVIPEVWNYCIGVIIISLLVCVLLVILGTAEPKE